MFLHNTLRLISYTISAHTGFKQDIDMRHWNAFMKLFMSLFVFLGFTEKDQGFTFKLLSDEPGLLYLKLKPIGRNILFKLLEFTFLNDINGITIVIFKS